MLRDPVTDFEYPGEWVKACKSPELMGDVRSGLCVLTASGRVLRRGYTTGTTAAAACKAAVLSLKKDTASVRIRIPCGMAVSVPVTAKGGRASAFKFSGDYRDDATSGAEFFAVARPSDRISFAPGPGIGRFSRELPGHPAGTFAIGAASMACILDAVGEGVAEAGLSGAAVELSVPRGEEIARETLNEKLGIKGGISVLGTTGLVEPWDDHVGESAMERIERLDRVVITTGRSGLRYSRLLFPDHEAVLVGTRIEQALRHARGKAIVCGLPALILRFIDPGLPESMGYATVSEMSSSPEWASIVDGRLREFKDRMPEVRVVLVDRDGKVIGDSG